MKKRVLCIALALLMCMMVALPAFADGEEETPPERAPIAASFDLMHVSGSTYRMWVRISNPLGVSVSITLALYDASYSLVSAIGTVSSDTIITLSKIVTLSSGTYHLRLSYTVEGITHTFEKPYTI